MHPDLGHRSPTSTASSAAAKQHGLEIALDFAMQCSPDHPWVKRAPRVVQPPARRHASSTPRTRRRSTRTSTRSTSTEPTGAGCGRSCARSCCFWIDRGVRDLPRRQPAHQAARVLGVADHRGPARSTPTCSSSPRRSPAQALMRGSRRSASRSPTPTSPGATRAAELDEYPRSSSRASSATTCGRTSSPTPPTSSRVPAEGRPAGVHGAPRARRDAVADLRHLLGLRALRERAAARGLARST